MLELLIADDHPVVRSGIRNLLRHDSSMRVAGEASCAAELMQQLGRRTFDVVLLDLMLPDSDGCDVLALLRSRYPMLPVIVFTNRMDARAACIESGAAGFVGKDAPVDVLKLAIACAACQGDTVVPQEHVACAPHLLLSQRELDVMLGLVRGTPAKALAFQLGISQKTVATHRMRLMKKLNVSDNRELLLYALRSGLTDWS